MKLTLFVKFFFVIRFDETIWHLTIIPDGKGGCDLTLEMFDELIPHFSLDITPAFATVPAMSVLPAFLESAP